MASKKNGVGIDDKKLRKLIEAFGSIPSLRVGVLGATASRSSGGFDGVNNATIGAFHEFGTSKMPMRSWLRMPINEKLMKAIEDSGALNQKALDKVVDEGSAADWMKKIGVLAEGVILEAFQTGGYGKWKASKMGDKKNHQTLVETQQLMKAVTSELVTKKG